MSALVAMYGKLEGEDGRKFAREISPHLAIEAGIYKKHGIDLQWQHVQGTEERYRRLASGAADISFVVGRQSLKHFLQSKTSVIVGSPLNSCPYHFMAAPAVKTIEDLKGKTIACREEPARNAPIGHVFKENAGLELKKHVKLTLLHGDLDAYEALIAGRADAALVPRQFGFVAEDKGFHRLECPDVVDDPLPITIETTKEILAKKSNDIAAFLQAHAESVRHLKGHRAEALRLLQDKFGQSASLAAKTFDGYFTLLNDSLKIDMRHLKNLAAQVAPDYPGGAETLAKDWLASGVVKF
ncbi:MAG TPA: ABC transporter substrate-binding protein [Candidatus Binatia bacterium]|jgi:ABC-type nitrate/sulfonate/bicarbonate transport system substrate-binding protein